MTTGLSLVQRQALRLDTLTSPTSSVESRLRVIGLWPWLVCHAREHYVTPTQVIGRSRERQIVRARHRAWAHVYREHGYSLSGVARLFDVDHSTVMYALKKLEKDS